MKILVRLIIISFVIVAEAQQEIILKDVQVEGNIISSSNTIIFTSGLRKGLSVSSSEFPRAVKRLWQLGLFDDIQIRYDNEDEEGLSLTIIVKESSVLGDVHYKGNRKIKIRKFEEELNLVTGQRIKPNLLYDKVKKIEDLYAEKGYLMADVNAELTKPENESNLFGGKARDLTQDIIFKIKENKKVKLSNIRFEGNETYSDLRLRLTMKDIKQQRWYFFWRAAFDQDKFEEDLENIRKHYRNKGYRDFKIISDSVHYTEDKQNMDLVLTVKEGPMYKYRNFSWDGQNLYNEKILSQALGLEKGDKYSQEDFEKAVYERMQNLYMDRGYIYSRIEPQITPAGMDSLDIHFVIVENHKVYIRNIVIRGNEKTRENVIRRQLRIFPGDVFNKDRLMRSYREIMMLNYFGNVLPDVVPIDDDEVDVEIVVEEKPSGTANMQMGFSQAFGVTGGGGFSLPNWKGKGQHLALSFDVGTNYGNSFYTNSSYQPSKKRQASFSFTDPMVNDTKNLLGASIFYSFRGRSSMYYSPLDATMVGSSLRWGRRFKWPDDFFRGSWSFQILQRMYEAETQEELEQYTSGLNETIGVNITQAINRDSRDHPEFTTQGSLMSITSTISGGPLGGNEDFHKHVLNLEWYTPTFWKFVLMSSLKLGAINMLPSMDDERSVIPFSERFIMGGNGLMYGNPLRGYEDNRVGPMTSRGNPVGGNALAKVAMEFRVPFSENPVVYGLIFAEMGNVWAETSLQEKFSLPRVGPFDLKRSTGAGIRFFMPMIGMLGFDLGYGFDDLDGDGEPEGWKTTLTIGQQYR
tara:strand:- start:11754 stop:14165 length:2412 start_codon:yes stop_codon:yes gene_type:complete